MKERGMLQAWGSAPDSSGGEEQSASDAKLRELDQALAALLAELQSRQARGALTLHDPVLALAREHVEQAVAIGAGAEHRAALEALLGALAVQERKPARAESRTPHHNGIVLPAAPVILKGHDAFRWKTSKEARESARPVTGDAQGAGECRAGQQSRRFKRYRAPSLWVSIEGMHYRTVDWSIGGLALTGCQVDLTAGREVKVTLAANIREMQPALFADRAVVLRADWEAARLILQFRSSASATLKILEYLSRKRIEPAEVGTAGAA
jgi:hypothetical protein